MEAFISNKQNAKILRVYLLKNCYQICRGLEKQVANSLYSYCLVLRKEQMKNDTEFGYKEELKTGILKKIHFIYLPHINDLFTFLWAHVCLDKPVCGGIFIDGLEQYFGQGFSYEENGNNFAILMNLLQKLGEKALGKKGKVRLGFTFIYNSYIFSRGEFISFMGKFGVNTWEISGQQLTKNGQMFDNEQLRKFFQIYGIAMVKSQEA